MSFNGAQLSTNHDASTDIQQAAAGGRSAYCSVTHNSVNAQCYLANSEFLSHISKQVCLLPTPLLVTSTDNLITDNAAFASSTNAAEGPVLNVCDSSSLHSLTANLRFQNLANSGFLPSVSEQVFFQLHNSNV